MHGSGDLQYCREVDVVTDFVSADGRPRLLLEGLGRVKKSVGMTNTAASATM